MFKKKVVFISGSSSGIGFGLAKLYKGKNYTVIINGRNQSKLKKSSSSLGNCHYIVGDMTKKNDVEKVVKNIKDKFKFIDLLICNQGNSDYEHNNLNFKFAFENNFFSTINLITVSKKILKKNNSKVICISSICGSEVIAGAPIGYSLAKSALNSYIKIYSRELAKDGITINGIVPGNILFEGSTWQKKLKKNLFKTKKYIKENVPMNKFGNVENIFLMCRSISEDPSNYLTGSLFTIDGGQTKNF